MNGLQGSMNPLKCGCDFVGRYIFLDEGLIAHQILSTCSGVQSCPTLCDPMDCSPPGSPVHGISQERILEWFPPGDLPDLGIKLASPALAGGFFIPKPQKKPPNSQQTFLSTKVNLSPELERTLRIPGHLGRGILELSPPAPRDHFLLLQEVERKWNWSCSVMSDSLRPHGW